MTDVPAPLVGMVKEGLEKSRCGNVSVVADSGFAPLTPLVVLS